MTSGAACSPEEDGIMNYRALGVFVGILCLVVKAHAVCVNDVAGFQAALTAAEGSTTTTIIEVARGTYLLGGTKLSFASSAAGQGQLDITGGYNDDCSTHLNNPALTIIDGQGLSTALDLGSTAGISVRYLTIQNGVSPSVTGGLVVTLGGGNSAAGIIVDYNIIRFNSGGFTGGLLIQISLSGSGETGDIHFDGNLVYGNTTIGSNGYAGGGRMISDDTGAIYVTNNTVAENNLIANLGFSGGLELVSTQSKPIDVSNNILWGNTKTDLDLANNPAAALVDNDYGNLAEAFGASIIGSLSVDPQFSGSSDFHLLPSSPLLGAGTLTPTGGLPTIDVEGHPRSYAGLVDMGAYERGDEIFLNDFDH
jgi:hypothetical protein